MIPSPLEFSRLVNIPLQTLENKPLHLKATPEECHKLAKRFGLEDLKKFEITLLFIPTHQPKTYPIKATFEADVVYTCVNTLDPFEDHVKETVEFIAKEFSPLESSEEDDSSEDLILTGEEETIEMLDPDGFLEIGEIMAQYLSLALNPYPRSSEKENKKSSSKISHPSLLSQEDLPDQGSSTYFPFKNLASLKNEKKPS